MRILKYILMMLVLGAGSVLADSQIEIISFWSSLGEKSALNKIREKLDSKGIQTETIEVDGYNELRELISERGVIDQQPEVSHWQWGEDLFSLSEKTELVPLPKHIAGKHITKVVKPEVLGQIEIDGEYIALPIGIHLQGVMIYNQNLLEKSGFSTPPTTWEDFFLLLDRLKHEGVLPFASSDQKWIVRDIFDSILGSVGGRKTVEDLYINFDVSNTLEEKLVESLDILFSLRAMAGDGQSDREWWQMVDLVADGLAGATMIGDFAQSQINGYSDEMRNSVVCKALPESTFAGFGVDVFVVFASQFSAWEHDYQTFVETILSEESQIEYLSEKGGVPVVNNLKGEGLQQCSRNSMQIWLENADQHLAAPSRNGYYISKIYRALPYIWESDVSDAEEAGDRLYRYLSDDLSEEKFLDFFR